MREMLAGVADRLSLHMPGAQGARAVRAGGPLPVGNHRARRDRTTSYAPWWAIARAGGRWRARCAGAAHTLMLTGGSTAGVQAMLLYAAGGGGR